jgi:hypothetical protein
MGLEYFKAALEALPEKIEDREDIIDFVAGVAVAYMSIEEAMQVLLLAAAKVAKYSAGSAESGSDWESKPDCLCPECIAKLEADQPRH